MKYKTYKVSDKQVEKIIQDWGGYLKCHYCENHHGSAYWNGDTGEILWYSEESDEESNCCLLPETAAKYNLKAE